MPEKEVIFSSKMKYNGVFSFKDYYKFCYDWLVEEIGLEMSEDEYGEKISGDMKEVRIKWTGYRKITDYFKFEITVRFLILAMKSVEVVQNGVKIKTNNGSLEMNVKAELVSDYNGQFDSSAFTKWLRASYEKWIVRSRVLQFSDHITEECDEFMSQAKSWLALEGKK